MINFNEPIVTGKEIDNIKAVINLKKISDVYKRQR